MAYKTNMEDSILLYDSLIKKADNDYDNGKFSSNESYLAYKDSLLTQQDRLRKALKEYIENKRIMHLGNI